MKNFGSYTLKKNQQIDKYDNYVDTRFEIVIGSCCIKQRILYYRIINDICALGP